MSAAVSSSVSPRREGWGGCLAILAGLAGLALCVGATYGLMAYQHFPRQLDRYVPLTPGEAALYRVTYAEGLEGLLSTNSLQPDALSRAYAGDLGASAAVARVQLIYTNWQGQAGTYLRQDHYARVGDRLFLTVQQFPEGLLAYEPAHLLWSADLLESDVSRPVRGETALGEQHFTYQLWSDGDEVLTLPDGRAAAAKRVGYEFAREGQIVGRTLTWYVDGVGPVRDEEYDADGRLALRTELLNSTRLGGPPTQLPLGDLLAGASPAASFFRGDAARSGAYVGALLPGAPLRVTDRFTREAAFTASPAYADGQLIVADQAGSIAALDAATGAVLWEFTLGGPVVAAPVVAGGLVYVGAADKRLYALEARRGLFVWSARLHDNIASSPVVADGRLFVGGEDRGLYALNPGTGAELWRYTTGGRIVGSPAAADGRVFVGAGDSLVYALEAATGRLIWRAALDAPVEASVAVGGDNVYAASRGRQVTALDAATGQPAWTVETRFGYHASPTVGDALVFVAAEDGVITAVDRATGRTTWEWRGDYTTSFAGSPLLLGEALVAVDDDGLLHVFDAASGRERAWLDLGAGSVSASPVWGDGRLFVTTQGKQVIAIGAGP